MNRLRSLGAIVTLGLGAAMAMAGCSAEDSTAITISAAASLRTPFDALIERFAADHPDVSVSVNYGASGELATQILEGAPADVVALASNESMDLLVQAGAVADPTPFAHNALAVVTKPTNPLGIHTLADLSQASVVALCGESAPCGAYAATVLDAAGVTLSATQITRARDASATLGAVVAGDADAAVVYVTDALAAGDAVEVIDIPAEHNAAAVYPIAVVRPGNRAGGAAVGRTAAAQAFVDTVLSDAGRSMLADAGFDVAGFDVAGAVR